MSEHEDVENGKCLHKTASDLDCLKKTKIWCENEGDQFTYRVKTLSFPVSVSCSEK